MSESKGKINHTRHIIGTLTATVMLLVCGCSDFFAEKPTELQAVGIISDLHRIPFTPDVNIYIPHIYKKEPQILETKAGVKLLYFTRHHTVEEFSGSQSSSTKIPGLIEEQFGYKVSKTPTTNQLIINCPTRQEAQMVLEFLNQVDVPPIQVKINCLVSELYADETMDWETTIKIENLLGEKLTLGGREVEREIGGTVEKVLLPAFPGASLRDEARSMMGLKVGYSRKLGIAGHEFRALVDLLISRGYMKILMNPTLEVVNGQTAHIEAKDYVPLPKEIATNELTPYMTTEYKWVTDSLEITPHVFADGYIGLETKATIGSKSTPEGVKQIPIITERNIRNRENRIRQGESLIIGGIRKIEERCVVRGVPLLKDIPLLGILFSSKDFEERAKEIIFIITPTISAGGIPNIEMVEKIRRKHEPPTSYKSMQESTIEPIRFKTRQKQRQSKLLQTEQADIKTQDVRQILQKLNEKLEKSDAHKPNKDAEKNQSRS